MSQFLTACDDKRRYSMPYRPLAFVFVLFAASTLSAAAGDAATFDAFIGFGDSEIDSGWWAGALNGQCGPVTSPCETGDTVNSDPKIAAAIANGGTGTAVGVGLMNSQIIAAHYGVTALPANQPGGTNYAISGTMDARVGSAPGIANANPNPNLPSTVEQIKTYLTPSGHADPNALYVISSGGNDVTYASNNISGTTAQESFLSGQAAALTTEIDTLQVDGAKTIVVYGLKSSSTLAMYYTSTLFSDLDTAGVDFIAANILGLVQTVQADPSAYGLLTDAPGIAGDSNTPSACVAGAGATGWGQRCANTTTPSTEYAHLRDADAEQTSLYSDDEHFSSAGQLIEANYVIGLIDESETPLPPTLPLFASALGALGLLGWRGKRKKTASIAAV
jgi:phospholipase/lecithinase/hemolysin